MLFLTCLDSERRGCNKLSARECVDHNDEIRLVVIARRAAVSLACVKRVYFGPVRCWLRPKAQFVRNSNLDNLLTRVAMA